MKLAHLSSITVLADRQRQEFDPIALQELKESIIDIGLMHPIVVRRQGDQLVLVAGERRLRALREINELGQAFRCNGEPVPADYVPYLTLGDLDELEAEEAELDENLKRRDLTWQELSAAHARLHSLRTKQRERDNATAVMTGQPTLPAQTVADTAKEIHGRSDGAYQDNVRKELIVAKHLANPEVAKAKSVDEAFKILKQQETRQANIALAVTVGKSFKSTDHVLLPGDCIAQMRAMRTNADFQPFDVILTDPPYGMNAHQFGDGAGKLAGITHQYDDSPETWRSLMSVWAAEAYAVAKPQAHAYVFCDIDRFHELKLFMETAGWDVFRTPMIVYKRNSGRVPIPDRGPRRQWEMVLFANKGNKPVTHIYSDVIEAEADKSTSHGAQKPVAVYQNLLMRSVVPGNRVLDSFAGSGTIFEACTAMKCYATGIEMEPEYLGLCTKRLKDLEILEQEALF